jgi:hypothetical protein
MTGIPTAPYEKYLKPFQQIDDHQQPPTETTVPAQPVTTDTYSAREEE